jgi:cleavage and polyadenylation specificity factor subunit 4
VHTKSAGDAPGIAKEEGEDITLNCRDCNAEFLFSAGEQEFYQSKGWENQPTRCTECKNAKKARFGEDAGSRGAPVCYAFQKGECTRGDGCRFSHDPNAAAPVKSGAPCYAFQKGECSRGDGCRFSHDAGAAAGGGHKASGTCYAHQKGECTRGDACRFAHE